MRTLQLFALVRQAHYKEAFKCWEVLMVRTIRWQKLEGVMIFIAGVGLFLQDSSGLSWWIAALVFLAPDLSFAGYLLGPKIGAFSYNLVHVYALGVIFLFAGLTLSIPLLAALGSLWLAHSGFDRMLGYGLKSPEGFTVTHLGNIGNASRK